MITNILLSGVGGQGILLAAKMIATAAELHGFQVTTNEIHGMAQRGGSVIAQIRCGDAVYSPLITEGEADVIGSLEEIEALRYAHYLKADGLAVVSRRRIIPVTVSTGQAVYPADSEDRLKRVFKHLKYLDCDTVAAELGDPRLSNTVLLGAISRGLPFSESVWEKSIGVCVKKAFLSGNLTAFRTGREA